MILYHGTHFKNLDVILKEGVTPRKNKQARKKRKSNFKISPSHPDMVYMSTAYPFYYATQAGEDITKGLVLEIHADKLDESLCYPDEDFVYQKMRLAVEGLSHPYIRDNLTFYQYLKDESLSYSGCMCYKGSVPVSAIVRYCVIDFQQRQQLAWEMMQPSISIMNYKVAGDKYRKIVQWCFGDIEELPFIQEAKNQKQMFEANKSAEIQKIKDSFNCDERIEVWSQESKDRTGIEVVSINEVK